MLKYKIFNTIFVISLINASGAYDIGSSAGKNNWDISITLNPFNLIDYGQDYLVISYGLTNKIDMVNYISKHYNGTKSYYLGGLYQFMDNDQLDLSTAIGVRKVVNIEKSNDLFFPQILYNYKINNKYSIGGSIVKVGKIYHKSIKHTGISIDLGLYKQLPFIHKKNKLIKDAYFGFGVFKNSEMKLLPDRIYFHYSFDFKLDLNS